MAIKLRTSRSNLPPREKTSFGGSGIKDSFKKLVTNETVSTRSAWALRVSGLLFGVTYLLP
jgi:hypothetical protein